MPSAQPWAALFTACFGLRSLAWSKKKALETLLSKARVVAADRDNGAVVEHVVEDGGGPVARAACQPPFHI